MVLEKTGPDGVIKETEEVSRDGNTNNGQSPSSDENGCASSDRHGTLQDSKLGLKGVPPKSEMTVDISAAGTSSDSGASLSPDSIGDEYRHRTETLSDEEINELYLGNVSAKNRRRPGVFGTPILKKTTEETSEYGGSTDKIEIKSLNAPERKISTVSFDLDTPEDYSHLQRRKCNPNTNGKQITFEDDEENRTRNKHGRRGSRVSFDESIASTDTWTKSETSYGSTPRGVASHVRRDSIALAMNGIPVLEKQNRFSLKQKMKEVGEGKLGKMNWKDKETYKKYVIHIFVIFVFLLSTVFVSLAWYYHHETETAIASSQQIFFDPRRRILTLSDPQGYDVVTAQVGQEIPSWQLPLHCPLVETGDQSKKECLWKRHAVLRINHFFSATKEIQCYNVSWESLNPKYVPYDCFEIGDVQWYGSSNLTSGSFPIQGQFDYNSNEFSTGNEGVLQSAVEYYWITSSGVALSVNSNIPTHLKWNTTKEGKMCLVSNFTIPFYDQDDKRLPHMNYTLCNGPNILQTHIFMRQLFSKPESLRVMDEKTMMYPHWSTVAERRSRDITQGDVEKVAKAMSTHGLNCSKIQIDGNWQSSLGDFEFDSKTFPNISNMLEAVENANCSLAVEVNPYFHFSSKNYNHGVESEYFVKDSGDFVPGLVNWQHGIASVLDVTNSEAREWFLTHLLSLTKQNNIKSLRFSYGNSDWLPHRPHFKIPKENPNNVRKMFTKMMYAVSPQLVLDNTAQSQNIGGFLSVKASIETRGNKVCISDIVSKSLTLGILGYPYIMSDGFRSYHDEQNPVNLPSKDLFIRWMQMSAFFPAMSFSLAPWSYDQEVITMSKNVSYLHIDLVMPRISSMEMRQELHNGLAIMRPIWMVDSTDSIARSIHDQFMVGDSLLVAPISCENTLSRDIYIPKGIWNDRLRSTLVVGPKWLIDYRVALSEIPHFVSMKVYD